MRRSYVNSTKAKIQIFWCDQNFLLLYNSGELIFFTEACLTVTCDKQMKNFGYVFYWQSLGLIQNSFVRSRISFVRFIDDFINA
jgi:hypothetical protein